MFSSEKPQVDSVIKFEPNDILIGNIRPYLKKIWFSDKEGGTNGDVVLVRIKNDFNKSICYKFLFYLLSSDNFFQYDNQFAKGAKMPRGDKERILDYKIPVPPLAEQQRIVSILDKFEALVSDLTQGLPAEIAASQERYEYYRDKLLRFDVKG